MQPATLAVPVAELDLKVRRDLLATPPYVTSPKTCPRQSSLTCSASRSKPHSGRPPWSTDWSAYLAARIEAVKSAAAEPQITPVLISPTASILRRHRRRRHGGRR